MIDFKHESLPGDELHKALQEMRSHGDVVAAEFGGIPCFVLLGYQALREAYMDDKRFPGHIAYQFSIEQSIGPSFISMPDPEPHRMYRKLATPAFRSHAVASYEESNLTELAHELLDELDGQAETPVDLVSQFTSRYPYLVISRLLGLSREQESEFHHWAMSLLLPELDPSAAQEAQNNFRSVSLAAIRERRTQPREDVISELIAADTDGHQLSDEEILSNIGLLFPTGGETTHGALGNLLYALLSNESLWQQLRESPELIPMAVNEGLRWESSVALLPRVSMDSEQEYYGAKIPANSLLLFSMASANRDPDVFDKPHEFLIERNAKETLEFGRGVKTCPGMHLARRNISVAVATLMERFPNLTLLDEVSARPSGATVRSPKSLLVKLA